MALRILKGINLPIGADLGSSEVKLAQLRSADGSFELVAAGSEELPRCDQNDLSERLRILSNSIRGILRSNAFRGRSCILALPGEVTFVKHVKLPKLGPEQTIDALRLELRNKLPADVEQMVIRYVVAGDIPGEGRAQQEVIVIAAVREILEAYIAMARRAKLDVVGVNAEPCATVECFSHLFRRSTDTARTILFIDIGATSTQVVLSHGNRIVFSRILATGGDTFDETVAKSMGISPAEAHALRRRACDGQLDELKQQELYRTLDAKIDEIAGEVAHCLSYYESVFKNRQVERVIFLGGQAHDKQLCQALAKQLNLPATIGDPLACIKRAEGAAFTAPDQRQLNPNWAIAIGLSLGAMQAA